MRNGWKVVKKKKKKRSKKKRNDILHQRRKKDELVDKVPPTQRKFSLEMFDSGLMVIVGEFMPMRFVGLPTLRLRRTLFSKTDIEKDETLASCEKSYPKCTKKDDPISASWTQKQADEGFYCTQIEQVLHESSDDDIYLACVDSDKMKLRHFTTENNIIKMISNDTFSFPTTHKDPTTQKDFPVPSVLHTSPDGQILYTDSTNTPFLHLWDPESISFKTTITIPNCSSICCLESISPTCLCIGTDGPPALIFWDLEKSKAINGWQADHWDMTSAPICVKYDSESEYVHYCVTIDPASYASGYLYAAAVNEDGPNNRYLFTKTFLGGHVQCLEVLGRGGVVLAGNSANTVWAVADISRVLKGQKEDEFIEGGILWEKEVDGISREMEIGESISLSHYHGLTRIEKFGNRRFVMTGRFGVYVWGYFRTNIWHERFWRSPQIFVEYEEKKKKVVRRTRGDVLDFRILKRKTSLKKEDFYGDEKERIGFLLEKMRDDEEEEEKVFGTRVKMLKMKFISSKDGLNVCTVFMIIGGV